MLKVSKITMGLVRERAKRQPWLPVRDTLYTDDTLRVQVEGEVMVVPAFDPRVPVHGFQRRVDGEWQDLQPLPHPIRKRDRYYSDRGWPSVGLVPAVGHRPATGGLWAPSKYRVVLLEGGRSRCSVHRSMWWRVERVRGSIEPK